MQEIFFPPTAKPGIWSRHLYSISAQLRTATFDYDDDNGMIVGNDLTGKERRGAARFVETHYIAEDNDYAGGYSRIFTAIIAESLDSTRARVLVIFATRFVKEPRRLPRRNAEDLPLALCCIVAYGRLAGGRAVFRGRPVRRCAKPRFFVARMSASPNMPYVKICKS